MSIDEVSHFLDKILNYSPAESKKQIALLDNDCLYYLANHLIEKHIDYYYREKERRESYCDTLVNILTKLLSDEEEFELLFCKFLEGPYQFWANKDYHKIIKNVVVEKSDVSFSIVKSIVNKGEYPGLSAGILLSMIHDAIREATEFLIKGLESKSVNMQKCSLVALLTIIDDKGVEYNSYLDILEKVSADISNENEFQLIQCLKFACIRKPQVFITILEREIQNRGSSAAHTYIRFNKYNDSKSIQILKIAIQVLESENADEEFIDEGLAKVYEFDPSFVVERVRNRLNETNRINLMDSYLESQVKEIGSKPLIDMIESEIDIDNPFLRNRGETILEGLFRDNQEWISWCEKWRDCQQKESIILKSLGLILTKFINTYETDDVRERAIQLVHFFAKKNNLDYAAITKGINMGADTTKGHENKENTIKALVVLDEIITPPVKIDCAVLQQNLNNAPCLCKAFELNWLLKNAKSKNPHIINYIFSDRPNPHQHYLENVFCILEKNGIVIKRGKIRDVDNDINILTEVEVISKLVPFFKVTPEPDIEELRPKNLDIMIEYNGEKALIEIATLEEKLDIKLAHGAKIFIPGGKVKNILLNKFKSQLKEGNVNVSLPIIIILNLKGFLDDVEVQNGIQGELQFSYEKRNDTHEIVGEGPTRANNGFYDEEKTEMVTAIASYKQYHLGDFKGKFYRPFRPSINRMSQEFMVRLRDALFGNSEISDWRTLMKIPGIDEELAKLFYSKGIDDITVLSIVTENEFVIEGVSWEQISYLKNEAIRVINALSTGSIKYLSKIDAASWEALEKEGIYLINQLLEKEEAPNGMSEYTWNLLKEDARRVLQ